MKPIDWMEYHKQSEASHIMAIGHIICLKADGKPYQWKPDSDHKFCSYCGESLE